MREASIVLCEIDWYATDGLGSTVVDMQIGQATHVEFDFMKVWQYMKRNKPGIDELHFVHVHPPGVSTHLSEMDKVCMRGFFQAFGSNEFGFTIVEFEDDRLDSIECEERMHYYDFDFETKREIGFRSNLENNLLPWHLEILKHLSYGKFKGE